MAQTEDLLSASGSIADVSARLALWGKRAAQGLARVSFSSDYARQEADAQVKAALASVNVPFHTLPLPQAASAERVVAFLTERLAALPFGIVSITGWATAFDDPYPHAASLRVLNQNRENLARFPLCQVWWMTPRFTEALLQTSPDLASWFMVRLNLTESIAPPVNLEGPWANFVMAIPHADNASGTVEEARRLSVFMVERFNEGLKNGFPFIELAYTAVLAAEELHKVGAEAEEDTLLDTLFARLQPFPKAAEIMGQLEMLPKQDALLIAKAIGFLFWRQANYEEAEQLIGKVLSLRQELFGPNHPEAAKSLNDLALVYDDQARYQEAETLYRQAIALAEAASGPDSIQVATHLSNLAVSYVKQGRFTEAEPLFLRSLTIKAHTPEYPDTALTLRNLASIYSTQGRLSEAEQLLQRALAINQRVYGRESRQVAINLSNLGYLWMQSGLLDKAQEAFKQALAIDEKVLGPEHPETALSLNNLSSVYFRKNRFSAAEPLLRRAVAIAQKVLGPDHPDTILFARNYHLLHDDRQSEAAEVDVNESTAGPAATQT